MRNFVNIDKIRSNYDPFEIIQRIFTNTRINDYKSNVVNKCSSEMYIVIKKLSTSLL